MWSTRHWHEECGSGEHDETKLEWGSFILVDGGRSRGRGRGSGHAASGPGTFRGRGRGRAGMTGRFYDGTNVDSQEDFFC